MHAETLRRRVEPEPAPEAPPEAAEARRVGPRPIVAPPERFEMPEPEQSSSMWCLRHDLRGHTCDLRDPDGVCNHDPLPCVHVFFDKRGPEQRGSP